MPPINESAPVALHGCGDAMAVGGPYNIETGFNGDGFVNASDLQLLVANRGRAL